MKELDRVLAEPGSKAARLALAAAWRSAGEPDRADLIEKQIELFERQQVDQDWASPHVQELEAAINRIIAGRGRELAGRVTELAKEYKFRRGLVGQVSVTGERFPAVARELFSIAPIQHVNIVAPLGDLTAILAVPELARVVSLAMTSLPITDREAIQIAGTASLAGLRWADFYDDNIREAGVEAFAASPYFARCEYLGFRSNPCDPTPEYSQSDGVPQGGRPPKAAELERTFGARPWLAIPDRETPDRDMFAITP